ncbi:MAG: DNA polymerase I, partial [Deltaproteobacteria bacterium]|nr:DNA polymerase I [Deltaproteobacteria bacterium]
MSSPFYIVDGSGYIFRAFYAVHSLTTKTGFPTNALFGFTRMMTKLIREIGDARLGVCFDLGEPTFRHAMYDQYKANRDECPEDLVKQMPYFRKIVRALNLEVLEQAGVEADDIIGSLTLRFKSEAPIIIVSGDKDLCQLVGPGVTVWDAMRDIRYDPAGVKAKFGVYPEQIIDYLTLVGDSSDNVPGVKGIGPKTAVQLLEQFHTLDAILENPARITEIKGLRGASSIRTKIEEGLELVRLSKRLVTLKTDVAPFHEWASLESFQLRDPDADALKALFQELEFDALLTGLSGRSAAPSAEKIQKQYHCVNAESLRDVVAVLQRQPAFAFDTETSSLDPLTCDLAGISISWREGEAYYFPIGAKVDADRNLPIEAVRAALGPIFADPTKKKYGLNLKYDLAVLRTHGFVVEGIAFDSMLASYVLSPDRRQHNLAALTERYLAESMESFSTLTAGKDSICDVPLDDVTRYACHDAEASFRLEEKLSHELLERDRAAGHTDSATFPSLQYVLHSIEMPLVRVLEDMERNGIRLDLDLLNRFASEFVAELATLERDIHALAGEPFNINSPKQLSVVLFEKLAIPSAG